MALILRTPLLSGEKRLLHDRGQARSAANAAGMITLFRTDTA